MTRREEKIVAGNLELIKLSREFAELKLSYIKKRQKELNFIYYCHTGKIFRYLGMKLILITLAILFIQGCSSIPGKGTFQYDACIDVYCANSEGSSRKAAWLKLSEIAASIYNVDMDLGRGLCEERYTKRVFPDYRYSFQSAAEVCNGGVK